MDPVLLDLGIIQIRYYGLMYAIGLFIALEILKSEVKRLRLPLNEDQIFNALMWTFVGGLLGARLYYVMFNTSYYFGPNAPWYEFLAVWHGGLAIHGGVLGGTAALAVFCKYYGLSFLTMVDIASPPLILAQGIGRIGNLMNGDAHGYPTEQPWGLVFKYGPAAKEFPGQALHPVMIYEMILNFIAFAILFSLRKKGFRPGFIGFCYVIAYSINRFIVSFFRADDLYMFGVRAPHVVSIAGFLFAIAVIISMKLYQRKSFR